MYMYVHMYMYILKNVWLENYNYLVNLFSYQY